MGETWGISGPAFLAGYLLLAAVTWAVTTRRRRTLAEGRAALHDRNGARIYSDTEHQRRETELRMTFRRTIAEAAEASPRPRAGDGGAPA